MTSYRCLFVFFIGALSLHLVYLLPSSQSVKADPIAIQVSWNTHDYNLHTIPTFQIVTNPLVSRQFSPVSRAIFDNLKQLNAEYARFAVWFPYPKLAVAELDPPSGLAQCANVAENFSIDLSCERGGGVISKIDFASFGTATGYCGQIKEGTCNAANSSDIIQKACVGQQKCSVPASASLFGDPCKCSFQTKTALIITIYRPWNTQTTTCSDAMQSTTKQYLLELHLHRSHVPRLSRCNSWPFTYHFVFYSTQLAFPTRFTTHLS